MNLLKTLFLVGLLCSANQHLYAQETSEKLLKKHIYTLADDRMQGRGTGSTQLKEAASYIEKAFKKYGLQPKGTQGYRQSFTAKVTRVKVVDSLRQAENIIGYIDNNAAQTIVIGAHYDHLGLGYQGSSRDANPLGNIHNGADDNASGVAALLELARYYAGNKQRETYNFLFIAFAAEELGLLGSKYFCANPTIPIAQINCMLNMDMIGRYNPENGLAIIGYGTSSAWPQVFESVKAPIKFYTSKDGNGGSDQTSFYKKDIPVLFFHTGGHPDYHATGDDAEKIDYVALKAIINLEKDIIHNILKIQHKFDFQFTN